MASNSKGKQPVRRHGPSHLRQEITADSTEDERGASKSVVQVLDSQVVVPETQYGDSSTDNLPDDFGNYRELVGRAESEQRILRDEAFVSRRQVMRTTTTAKDTAFRVNFLERPKESDELPGANFSPFFRAAGKLSFKTDPQHITTVQKSPPSILPYHAPQAVQEVPANGYPLPDLSELHKDEQGLPVARSLVPPEINANATSKGMPTSTVSRLPANRPVYVA